MATKMRLQRFGKKVKPFYHIVIADGRAPRDGRFIEKIGTYNPVQNPAEINLMFDKALDWLQKGAQPSDTVKSILSFKGVLYKHHLLKGVRKGAMTEAQAEAKFQKWLNEKETKIEANLKNLEETDRNARKEVLEAETKIKEAREAELNKKRQAEVDAKAKASKDAADAIAAKQSEKESEEVAEKVETQEAPAEEVKETPEAKEETPEEKKEEVAEPVTEKPEVKEETPEVKEEVPEEKKEEVAEPVTEKTEAKDETPEVKEEVPEKKKEVAKPVEDKTETKEETSK